MYKDIFIDAPGDKVWYNCFITFWRDTMKANARFHHHELEGTNDNAALQEYETPMVGGDSHQHVHRHVHTNTKEVLNRLSRAIGHMESIKRMIEDGRDCSEVLIQLAAVKAAINSTCKVILKDHMDHCIVDAIESGDKKALEELNHSIEMLLK